MNIFKKFLIGISGVVFIAPLTFTKAEAVTITQVNPAELTGTALITFDDVAGFVSPSTSYDTIFESNGANFAERFVGQTLSFSGDFDVLSGTPTGPLALQVGSPGQNLNIYSGVGTLATNALSGLGSLGDPNFSAIGEGSFAVLFDFDQSEFGFDLVGGEGGSATVNFFRRDGSLADTIVLGDLASISYGFRRDGGIKDIAGISIDNTDFGGMGFDNLRSDVPGVPGVPDSPEVPTPIPDVPTPPTEIPFEFSPSLGILLLGAWGAIAQLKSFQKRKSSAQICVWNKSEI